MDDYMMHYLHMVNRAMGNRVMAEHIGKWVMEMGNGEEIGNEME